MNREQLRNLHKRMKYAGLIDNYDSFATLYCGKSRNYLRGLKENEEISEDVVLNIQRKISEIVCNLPIKFRDRYQDLIPV